MGGSAKGYNPYVSIRICMPRKHASSTFVEAVFVNRQSQSLMKEVELRGGTITSGYSLAVNPITLEGEGK